MAYYHGFARTHGEGDFHADKNVKFAKNVVDGTNLISS